MYIFTDMFSLSKSSTGSSLCSSVICGERKVVCLKSLPWRLSYFQIFMYSLLDTIWLLHTYFFLCFWAANIKVLKSASPDRTVCSL